MLDAALTLFWARGFDGTSLEQLCEATGLVRASLYGAFGDKAAVFHRSLDRYAVRLETLGVVLQSKGVRAFLEAWLALCLPRRGPRGCMLLLSAQSAPDEATRRRARAATRACTRVLEQVIARDELANTLGRADAASLITTLMHGIATGARTGRTRRELQRSIDATLTLLA